MGRGSAGRIALGDALEETEGGDADEVYFSTLTRYVGGLGVHLDVRALFPDETITLLREPEDGVWR